jgi:hyperosmotically inducible protein
MKTKRILITLMLSAAIAACQSTPTSRSTGETLDDAKINASVKTELTKTEGLGQALAINVDTYRGTVSLSGFVDNEQQRMAAGRAAAQVKGVEKVSNNLKIKPRQ